MSIHHLKIPLIVLNDRHICVMIIKVASYRGAICQYWDWKGAVMIKQWMAHCTTVMRYCDVILDCDVMWCDGLLGQNKLIQNPSRLLDLLIWWRQRWWGWWCQLRWWWWWWGNNKKVMMMPIAKFWRRFGFGFDPFLLQKICLFWPGKICRLVCS